MITCYNVKFFTSHRGCKERAMKRDILRDFLLVSPQKLSAQKIRFSFAFRRQLPLLGGKRKSQERLSASFDPAAAAARG